MIMMTSTEVQPPAPMSSISMGRGPMLRPPMSGEPSMIMAWPLSDSAMKQTFSTHLTRDFMAALLRWWG
jgi:hypothetical protein